MIANRLFKPLGALAAAGLLAFAARPVAAQAAPSDAGSGAGVAAGTPAIFGPVTYTRTQGAPDVFDDSFNAPGAGSFTLWVKNGDQNEEGDDDHRVSSASITLNGTVVVDPSEFNQQVSEIRKSVPLNSGVNAIHVQINGQPGSYITVAINGMPVNLTHGRLILPWTWGNAPTRFGLKNGSHEHRRMVQAVFFNPDGTVAYRSRRLLLNPHGSIEVTMQDLLGVGGYCPSGAPFNAGSVEFYWSGFGPARVFGQVITTANNLGEQVALPLQRAGYWARRDPPPDAGSPTSGPTGIRTRLR